MKRTPPTQSTDRKPWNYYQEAKDFHAKHNRSPYTMVFNQSLETEMMDRSLAKEWRILAAIRRYSWGNLCDWAVDGMPPKKATEAKPRPLTQEGIGEMLGLSPASMSEGCSFLRESGYLKKDHLFLSPEPKTTILESVKEPGVSSDSKNSYSPFVRFRETYLTENAELGTTLSKMEAERKSLHDKAREVSTEIRKIDRRILGLWRDAERTGDSLRYCAPAQHENGNTDETKANCTSSHVLESDSNSNQKKFEPSRTKKRPKFDPSRTASPVTPIDSTAPPEPLLNSYKEIHSGSTTTTVVNGKASSSSPSPIQSLPIPREFVSRLPQGFTAAGKPTPTRAQITAAYIQVGPRWEEFLDWLPLSDEFRRMTHPGGLPTLIGFFLESEPGQQPQRRPQTRAEESRAQVIAGMKAIDEIKRRSRVR